MEAQLAKCSQCGGDVIYDPDAKGVKCTHCGFVEPVQTKPTEGIFYALDDGFLPSSQTPQTKKEAYKCQTCGAVTEILAHQVTRHCPFCGSVEIRQSAFQEQAFPPSALIPFRISKKKAQSNIQQWLKKGWFHPNSLAKSAQLEKFHGIYVPTWLYNAEVTASYKVEIGYYYYVTVEDVDSEGNRITRQEQRVRWEPHWGTYSDTFNNVSVEASSQITQDQWEKILPFSYTETWEVTPQFFPGYYVELYEKGPEQAWTIAEAIIDRETKNRIVTQLPGDTYRNLQINIKKHNVKFRHLLLPIWVSHYTFKGKTYYVLVNGETGKVGGKKPISVWKVIFAILIVILLILGIYYLANQ